MTHELASLLLDAASLDPESLADEHDAALSLVFRGVELPGIRTPDGLVAVNIQPLAGTCALVLRIAIEEASTRLGVDADEFIHDLRAAVSRATS